MNAKLLKPISAVRTESESLFSGVWIHWSYLNAAERLVCAIIVLMPLWWVLGLVRYILELVTLGLVLYEWRRYGGLRLKRPSLVVLALFAYYIYEFAGTFLLFFDAHPLAVLPPDVVRQPIDLIESGFSALLLPYLVWYIQSNNVRVRLEVVAWAFSVSVVQMLAVWFVVHFVFAEAPYNPPPTLLGLLTGKSKQYARGIGNASYLVLYWPNDNAIGGLARFYSFFYHPEYFGLFVSVVGILALDIKNRLWSLLLFAASVFLVGLSGTRAVWIAFPVVMVIRLLLVTGKFGGPRLIFTLIAIMSFTTLSLPSITDAVINNYTNTATSVANFRAESTEDRLAGYKETVDRVVDNPVNFLLGHEVAGPRPTALGSGVEIGSHSFILGSLLYKGGLVVTGFFMTFWASLIIWLYRTRMGRPVCCFLILLLLSITFVTMLFGYIAPLAILLSMIIRKPAIKSLRRNSS